MVPNYAEEQIKRFYRVPTPDTSERFIKFRYTAEIVERICTNPVMRKNFEYQSIGSIMSRLGFPKAHRRKGNGWFVVEKEGGPRSTAKPSIALATRWNRTPANDLQRFTGKSLSFLCDLLRHDKHYIANEEIKHLS